MGGRNPEKEGNRPQKNRSNRKKNNNGQGGRDGGQGAGGFSGPQPGLDGMNPSMMPPGLMSGNASGGMGMRCGEMPSSTAQGPPGMMPPQQFAPGGPGMQQQFFVSPAMSAMPNCYSYGAPNTMPGMCAYGPPPGMGAGGSMGPGMYQPTPGCANLYQAPPQYAQQPQQQARGANIRIRTQAFPPSLSPFLGPNCRSS